MTDPAYVNGTSFANGILGVTSAPLNRPASATTDDVLLAFVAINHTGTISPPSGWTLLDDVGEDSIGNLQTRLYQRRIPDIATEPASYTWTFSSGACTAVIEAWRNVGIVYLPRQDADLLSLLSHDTDTINNQIPGSVVVSCFTGISLLTLGWQPHPGDTERFDITGGLLVLLNVNMMVADTPTPIATGTVSRTATTVGAVQGLAAIVLLTPVFTVTALAGGATELMSTTEQSRFAASFLTTEPANAVIDLDACIGQRQETYEFELVDIVTGYRRTLNPLFDQPPTLSHDTSRTIKRQLRNLWFGKRDTADLNTVSARIEIFMNIGGGRYPLGQYLFNDQTRLRYLAGIQSSAALYDSGFIVDQPVTASFPFLSVGSGAISVETLVADLLRNLPVTYTAESSPYRSVGSWAAGASGGSILEQLALDGDWFSPWFDNTNVMRFIRVFDPATAIPTFDYDQGNQVFADPPPAETDDLLNAPNRFVVISNGAAGQFATPAVGSYDIPSSAPHSIANRGFVIPQIVNRQVENAATAQAVAANLGARQTIFERVLLTTAPDPRHDSYDVIRWQQENWLELAWSMALVPGGAMTHLARKAYTA